MEEIWNCFCRLSLIVFIIICLNSILGDAMFRLQYSFPKVSSTSSVKINTLADPIQNNLSGNDIITVRGDKNRYILRPQAEYSLAGLVIARNTNFWFRDIMRSTFDDVCLMDIGVAWGELAVDKKLLYKHWKFKSYKSLGQSRRLEWRSKPPYDNTVWDLGYVSSHVSHTHLIPANANVMGALLTIKKNSIVKLDGYLVDIYTDKNELVARTSMSRHDKDSTSRGSGACEDMYVTKVQIDNKIYK